MFFFSFSLNNFFKYTVYQQTNPHLHKINHLYEQNQQKVADFKSTNVSHIADFLSSSHHQKKKKNPHYILHYVATMHL